MGIEANARINALSALDVSGAILEERSEPLTPIVRRTMDTFFSQNRSASPNFVQTRRIIQLICAEFISLPALKRWAVFCNMTMLLPFILYFSDEHVLTVEKLTDDSHEPEDLRSARARSSDGFRQYLTAIRKVPWIYVLPSLFFVTVISVEHVIAHTVLKKGRVLRAWDNYYEQFAASFGDPRWARDLALDVRPLLFSWFLLVPPIVMLMMAARTAGSIVAALNAPQAENKQFGMPCFRFRQMVDQRPSTKEKEFFYSPWFTPVALAPFILGIPGAISMWIYWHTGLDGLLGDPAMNHEFTKIIPVICLYISSLGWALSSLFLRAYFTFGFTFTSNEYDIEIYSDVIKCLPMKGWFADFMTMRSLHAPSQIMWKDVTSVKLSGERQELQSKTLHPVLDFCIKLGESFESVAKKLEVHTEHLVVKSDTRSIEIRLWELNSSQKLELFRNIREHAPSIYMDAPVQKALTGTSVLREPKYTEIWFSVLQNHTKIAQTGDLQPLAKLKNGRYQIEQKIASGGQGIVYSALRDDGRKVVLKEFILMPGESIDVMIESARDFENESKILDQLDHPKIVKLIDMFHAESRVYIALEYVEGESLRQLVQSRGALADDEVMRLGEQMCEILAYLHSQSPPIIHRDFTPENIILQPDGTLKLIDFSVAQNRQKENSSECAGKHAYTPPEQFRGEAVPESDLYACGATMYFLASGVDPEPITTSVLPAADGVCRAKLARLIKSATALELSERCPSVQWLLAELKSDFAE